MGLETGTFIDSLVATNPVGATDPKSQGDDHLRLIKSTILASFTGITGAMSMTHTQLNNAAIKDEANVFTAVQRISTTGPRLEMFESDAGADEKLWRIRCQGDGYAIQTRTDADAAGITAIEILRTGTAVTKVSLKGTTIAVVEPTGADELTLAHDGTVGDIGTSAGHLTLTPGNQVVRLVGDTVDVTLELVVNGAIRGFLDYIESTSIMTLDSDGKISLATNNSEAVEIQNDGGILTPNLVADEFGNKGAPQNIRNTSYTLTLLDCGRQVYKASGGAGETITIPANSSVAFPIGTIVEIINDGGGDLSVAITTDTLEKFGGATGTQTLTDNNKAIVEKVTATLWKYSSTD